MVKNTCQSFRSHGKSIFNLFVEINKLHDYMGLGIVIKQLRNTIKLCMK